MNEIVGTLQSHEFNGKIGYQGGGSGGTSNYNDLIEKPSINDITLVGNKTLDELNIASKDYVEQELATFDFIKIVQELPETGLPNRTYLVTKENATENDLYDEYIWADGWEYLGTKKIEVDLTNYVKFTDIASGDKAGVVKLKGAEGIWLNGDKLTINEANESRIDSRTAKYPITPSILDYAIKSGLSTNKLEWTEEEKQSARELIGVGLAKTGTPGLLTGTTTYALSVNGSGGITCNKLTYNEYKVKTENAFVSVGTLRNVIDETIGDIETLLGGI